MQAVLTALYDQGTLAPDPAINTLCKLWPLLKCVSLSRTTTDPIQSQPAYHFATASGPTLGFGSAVGQPEQLHGRMGTPSFTPTWSFPTNISDQRAHRPQFRSTPTPLMNQGFNPLVPLNSATQSYQWNSGNPFPSSLDNIGAPSLSRDSRYPENLMGHMENNQNLGAAVSGQSPVPNHGAQAMGGW